MSGITGLIGGAMGASASKEAADKQFQASMEAMRMQQETDALNRQFYMDLYDKSQDVYNKEMMRSEPFREGGLFGLEMLIGTENFQAQIQPYVTQSQQDLWASTTYNQPGVDPKLQRQVAALDKLQADIDSGAFKPKTVVDFQREYGQEGGQKMFMQWWKKNKYRYEDLLPEGKGLSAMDDGEGGRGRFLKNPVIYDQYMRPIPADTIQQYRDSAGAPQMGPNSPFMGGQSTPATSQPGGQPVAPGGVPVGGAFAPQGSPTQPGQAGGQNGWWGGNQQGTATPDPAVPGPLGGGNWQGQPVGPGGGDVIDMAPTAPGGNMFTPQGAPLPAAQGGSQPGAMFSQPEYQGYQMGPEYTMEQFMADPSTQLALAEMQKGVESGAVARTGTLGPNQMRELMDRQSDYLYSKYPAMRGQIFGEQLSQKQQNEAEQQNAFNRWISGTLNPAQSLTGLGPTAGVGSAPQPGAPPYAGGGSQYLSEAGNAAASGPLGAASSWTNAMNQNANAGMTVAGMFLGGGLGGAAGAAGGPTIPNFLGSP